MEQIADDEGLVDVELELAVHATNGGGDVVTHDLGAEHGQSLALSRVDLTRHDAAAGLVLGKVQLAEATAGTTAEVSDVLGNLGEGDGQGVERAVCLDNSVVSSKGLELVGSGLELGAGHLGDLLGNALGEALEGVDASANGGTALGEESQVGDRALDALDAVVELGNVARELLCQGERGGILKMGSADLDDLLGFEIVNLLLESITQVAQRGDKLVRELENGGNMHDGGEGVVGGGAAVDMVVGVDGLLAAHLAAEDLNGTVGDDLVSVHVGLGTGTGLPDNEGEVVQELAISDLLSGLLDGASNLGIYAGELKLVFYYFEVVRGVAVWLSVLPSRIFGRIEEC